MTKTYVIESFNQIIEIGTTFIYNWFRGHPETYNNLTPSIFRNFSPTSLKHLLKHDNELTYAEEFKRYAPSIIQNLPHNTNNLEWLFLMQHHGLHTRLLDWSENILVATFFSVTNHPDRDGELWSMLPWCLNDKGGIGWMLPIPYRNPHISFLANEIFHKNPEELKNELGLDVIPTKPLALRPILAYPRYMAQQSCFTIHPKPEENNSIIEIIDEERFLVRYIIPKELKHEFEGHLRSLGASHKTLYHDLEGLSKTIIRQEESVAFSQPEHPELKSYNE